MSFVCLASAQGIHRQYIRRISKYYTALWEQDGGNTEREMPLLNQMSVETSI